MEPSPDIIVVGAGIIGCAVGYELARRGASVQILDERAVGLGATQASAGMLAPYIETRDDSPLFDLTVRSLGLYDDFIARVRSDSAMTVSYRRTGTLEVATDESGVRDLVATAEVLRRHGVDAAILDGAAVQREEPSLTTEVLGGLLIGTHGFVSATELTRAVSRAARRNGAQLVEHSRVTRISSVDGQIEVETERGSLLGDAVVLAAGSWSGSIDIDTVVRRVPVNPVRGQLLHLTWNGPRLRRVIWSPRCYLVPWDDGTVLVGATVEQAGFEERTTVAGVRALIDCACAIAPPAMEAGFVGARVGLRPGTADDLPILGLSTIVPNLMYATGHYRSGVLLAPVTAQLVADTLLDNRLDADLAAFQSRSIRRSVSYRIVAVERDGQWVARAEREDTGTPFGIDCTGTTEGQAIECLSRWLEWQSQHAAALVALQAAERSHHRTVADAFTNPTDEDGRRKEATLGALDAARVRLDRIRSRKPEKSS